MSEQSQITLIARIAASVIAVFIFGAFTYWVFLRGTDPMLQFVVATSVIVISWPILVKGIHRFITWAQTS